MELTGRPLRERTLRENSSLREKSCAEPVLSTMEHIVSPLFSIHSVLPSYLSLAQMILLLEMLAIRSTSVCIFLNRGLKKWKDTHM
jgi:hypothetical protein